MKKYLMHLIFVLILLFLFLHFSTRMNEPFVVMTPPRSNKKLKRSNSNKNLKKSNSKKKSYCVIS